MRNNRTVAAGAALSLVLLGAACGATTEQRAASGALIGAVRRYRNGRCARWRG